MQNKYLLLIGFFLFSFAFVSAGTVYTPSSETTCEGNICNKVLYSGTRFVNEDNQWKRVEDARSLKDKGFKIEILENDPKFPLEVIDYNYTSITVKLNPKGFKVFTENIPLRIWDINETKEEEFLKDLDEGKIVSSGVKDYKEKMEKVEEEYISFNLLNQKETITYNFKINSILEFGYNSTTIQLQNNETENLGDTYVRSDNPDTNYGSNTYIYFVNNTLRESRDFLRFNISQIPLESTISDATINLYQSGVATYFNTINLGQVYSSVLWDESTMTWNNQPCGIYLNDSTNCNLTYESSLYVTSAPNWRSLSALNSVNQAYTNGDSNVSFYITSNFHDATNTMTSYSKEYNDDESLRLYLNITYTTAGECTESIVNSTWSDWSNESCVSDEMNQSRFLTEYDENSCGTYENVTFYEYQLVGPTYENTTWSSWENESCLITDLMNQSRNLTQFDIYGCASNTTFFDFQQTESCDYCSYSEVNSTWNDWVNVTCLESNLMNQSRNLTTYDENYDSCYAVTGLPTDLWNSGDNITYFEFQQTESCDYCSPDLVNTTWSSWENVSCLDSDLMNQSRFLVQYDSNECGEISNLTFYEYQQTEPCDFCTPNLVNTTWSDYQNGSCLINDTLIQNRSLTEYDENFCGEVSNTTYEESQEAVCDYCSPSLVYTDWTDWFNTSSCTNDYYSQERNRTQYDENYASCYLITSLESDLVGNTTETGEQSVYCGVVKVCSSFERTGYNLIKIFSALILLGFVAGFGYFKYQKNGSLGMGDILIMFIGIAFSLAVLPSIFATIAGECGVY